MRVIIHVRAGADYPEMFRGSKRFHAEIERVVRQRLALRDHDMVEIKEEEDKRGR